MQAREVVELGEDARNDVLQAPLSLNEQVQQRPLRRMSKHSTEPEGQG